MTKRQFLATTAWAVAAAWAWKPTACFGQVEKVSRLRLDLNGTWQLCRSATDEWLPATVPGCVHTGLLAAGKIPDPFFRDNERSLQWIGDAVWIYRRAFDMPADLLQHDRVLLRCEGLDTLAIVKINGVELGRPDNMFRVWEFDVHSVLKPGENQIEITFDSPLAYMREHQADRVLYEWVGPHEPRGRAWVRKEPCNFGWDWAPVLITCGIWRDIGILAFDSMRLADVQVLQDHSVAGKASLQVAVTPDVAYFTPFSAVITLALAGKTLASQTVMFSNQTGRAAFDINDPKLWWPAGMGEQPLYDVRVELRNPDDTVVDTMTKQVGLRVLKLLPPDENNSLRFEVNGVPFFAQRRDWPSGVEDGFLFEHEIDGAGP